MFLLVMLLAVGCASWNCHQQVEGPVSLEIWHSLGGFAPFSSSIRLYSDGELIYEPPRGRKVCVLLRADEYGSIRRLFEAEQFEAVIREADADATHYGELEEIFVKTPRFSARVPLEVAPEKLDELLKAVASLLRRHAGTRATWDKT